MTNNEIEVSFTGLEQVDAALRELSVIERDRAVRAGLRAGGAYLIRQGRKRLRAALKSDKAHKRRAKGRKPGNLLRSFTNKLKRSATGVLAGFKRPEGSHSHIVDLGVPTDRKTHDGQNRGIMPALRYWSETREQDTDTALGYAIEGIEKAAIRKLAK